MKAQNPYAISFGRIPHQYISRDVLIESITETLNSDIVQEQAFKFTGIRGTGKTVTLTAIGQRMKEQSEWIVVNLKSGGSLSEDLVSELYYKVPFISEYVDASLDLSAFGIGVKLTKKTPISRSQVALEKIFTEIKKKKKRVLILVDEVHKTPEMVSFIEDFQIFIREEYPVYLIVAGLYEDIESIENTDGLTFFLRAERYEMKPLNITVIREDYKKTLGLDHDTADELARMTKGYAFAYQAFGKYMWESNEKVISDLVLAKVDEALSERVYDKIWNELTPKDRWFMSFIITKDRMPVSELLEMTKSKHNEWSEPRKRLIEKGILDCSVRGEISIKLPRFKEYVEREGV
jgi:hypothetical protein